MAKPMASRPDQYWNRMYELAKQYYEQNGDLCVPHDYVCCGKRLGRWIGTQRSDYKKLTNVFFTQERIDRLNTIGMVWDVKKVFWEDMFQELLRYASACGTVRVPQSYLTPEGKQLGIWVNHLRMDFKRGVLPLERQKLLEEAGMIWEPEKLRRNAWDIKFSLLQAYVDSHHGAFPSVDYCTDDGIKLGNWLFNQKRGYQRGTLLPERRIKLERLGILWDIGEQSWQERYAQAKKYYNQYGHLCLFLQRGGQNEAALGNWLTVQRQLYKKGNLCLERIQKLEEIGMVWDARENVWEASYQQAKAFFGRYGHLRIPKDSGPPEQRRLGAWIGTQRKNYMTRSNPLFTEERIRRLEEIGMIWDASLDSMELWKEWYRKAEAFYLHHGHLRPPKGPLLTWLHAQRGAKRGKRGSLSQDQIERLERIGMSWSPIEEDWMRMYGYSVAYYRIHHKLNIPSNYVTEDGAYLGVWISRQRKGYKNFMEGKKGGGRNVITPEHIELLNQIDMIWDGGAINVSTSFQEKAIYYYLKPYISDLCKYNQWRPLGVELDLYSPSQNLAIEYDGLVWHKEKAASDERKGKICREHGIRLIRVRERNLPEVNECETVIELENGKDAALENGIRLLFTYLDIPCPEIRIDRDRREILSLYRDYTSQKWDRVYQELHAYYKEYGTIEGLRHRKTNAGVDMTSWLYVQRAAYKKNELTPMQMEKLEELGFVWDRWEEKWMQMYRLAVDFRNRTGNLMIPYGYETGQGEKLGAWLSKQREKRRMGKLSSRSIYLLDQLGMVWNPMPRRGNGTKSLA